MQVCIRIGEEAKKFLFLALFEHFLFLGFLGLVQKRPP
jgi:hypothetical protein